MSTLRNHRRHGCRQTVVKRFRSVSSGARPPSWAAMRTGKSAASTWPQSTAMAAIPPHPRSYFLCWRQSSIGTMITNIQMAAWLWPTRRFRGTSNVEFLFILGIVAARRGGFSLRWTLVTAVVNAALVCSPIPRSSNCTDRQKPTGPGLRPSIGGLGSIRIGDFDDIVKSRLGYRSMAVQAAWRTPAGCEIPSEPLNFDQPPGRPPADERVLP